MNRFFANLLFFCLLLTLTSQSVIFSRQSNASLGGKILDENNMPLAGATIIIVGTRNGLNSNESGDYYFKQIPEGRIKIP